MNRCTMVERMSLSEFSQVPVIDVAPLVNHGPERVKAGEEIGRACRESGFFYIAGHGVDESLCERLEILSRQFFSQTESAKLRIAMAHGGRAWRGYFPVGGELTSGKRDRKEGLYFGTELAPDDPAVMAGKPLHGPNLFPEIPGFRETILQYLDELTRVGHALVTGISLGLGLREDYFEKRFMADPLILFRIFNYPPAAESGDMPWGVGEHTDYGLLTILRQDDTGGLQVKSRAGWVDAPPIPGTFICNIGDMLDRLTHGVYRSTPHRGLTRRAATDYLFHFSSIRISMLRSRPSKVSNRARRTILNNVGTKQAFTNSRARTATIY